MLHPHFTSSTYLDYLTVITFFNSTRWTDAFQFFLIPNSSMRAINTFMSIPMLEFWTSTFMNIFIPYSSVITVWQRKTCIPTPIEILGADTNLILWIPDHIPFAIVCSFTEISIPWETWLTFTYFLRVIPYLSIYAFNTHPIIEIIASLTNTFAPIPNLTTKAMGINTYPIIPVVILWTNTLIKHIHNLSTYTLWYLFTKVRVLIPKKMFRAYTCICVDIPNFSTNTFRNLCTSKAIPS